jgi:hypothetical protein
MNTIDRVYRPNLEKFSSDSDHLRIDQTEDWFNQEYNWIKPMASNNNVRHHFKQEYLDWIRTNITAEFDESNSGVMFFDTPQLPHTDTTRKFVLLYNVETGGPDASLVFWQQENYSILRERGLAVERSTALKELERINGPTGCWYLMNTQVLHSVEGVSERRLNLQISFKENYPADILC